MPELPEVKNAIYRLRGAVVNKTIKEVFINNNKLVKEIEPKEFKEAVLGKTIKQIEHTGKFIRFDFGDTTMINHLRMTGKWRFEEKLNKRKHDHVIFGLDDGYLFYNDSRAFGTFHIKSNKDLFVTKPLMNIALEPKDIDASKLWLKLKNRVIPIKSALLDQSLVAGLGNIYVNEALWKAGINPEKQMNLITLKEFTKVIEESIDILERATKAGGSTINDYESFNGEKGTYQNQLKVHHKEGNECPQCKNKIIRTRVGGRGTYWCPKCQH